MKIDGSWNDHYRMGPFAIVLTGKAINDMLSFAIDVERKETREDIAKSLCEVADFFPPGTLVRVELWDQGHKKYSEIWVLTRLTQTPGVFVHRYTYADPSSFTLVHSAERMTAHWQRPVEALREFMGNASLQPNLDPPTPENYGAW